MSKRYELILTLAIGIATCAEAQSIRLPEGKPITLDGTIRLVHGFGPPGYGEAPKSDARVTYWAIVAVKQVVAVPNQKDFDCIPSKRLKLFFPGLELQRLSELPAAKWKDQAVMVRGEIHCADTAGEMTSLYMDVDGIEAARKH